MQCLTHKKEVYIQFKSLNHQQIWLLLKTLYTYIRFTLFSVPMFCVCGCINLYDLLLIAPEKCDDTKKCCKTKLVYNERIINARAGDVRLAHHVHGRVALCFHSHGTGVAANLSPTAKIHVVVLLVVRQILMFVKQCLMCGVFFSTHTHPTYILYYELGWI